MTLMDRRAPALDNRQQSHMWSALVRDHHGSAVAHQAVAERHGMGRRRCRELRHRDDRRDAGWRLRSGMDHDRSSSRNVVVKVLISVPIEDEGLEVGIDRDGETALGM